MSNIITIELNMDDERNRRILEHIMKELGGTAEQDVKPAKKATRKTTPKKAKPPVVDVDEETATPTPPAPPVASQYRFEDIISLISSKGLTIDDLMPLLNSMDIANLSQVAAASPEIIARVHQEVSALESKNGSA